MPSRADINDRTDIERLVRAFYARALDDTMIGYLFTDVANLDLEAHVPVISDFWETILLGSGFLPRRRLRRARPAELRSLPCAVGTSSAGSPCGPRRSTSCSTAPFWPLEAKAHAQRVARAFHRRLRGLPDEPTAEPGGLLRIIPPTAAQD